MLRWLALTVSAAAVVAAVAPAAVGQPATRRLQRPGEAFLYSTPLASTSSGTSASLGRLHVCHPRRRPQPAVARKPRRQAAAAQMRDRSAVDLEEGDWVRARQDNPD